MSTVLREPSCECERGRPGEATVGSDWAWGATPTVGSRSEPARRAQTRAVDFYFCLPAGGYQSTKIKIGTAVARSGWAASGVKCKWDLCGC